MAGQTATRELRFGASDQERFSEYWKVTATSVRPELVLAGNRTGAFLHLTMHEDPAFWHIKVTLPEGVITREWRPPSDVLPGVRRLVRLLIPIQAVRYPPPKGADRVAWYPAPPEDRFWVEFTVLHRRAGRLAIKNADSLGAVGLADGSEAVIIGRHTPAETGFATISGDRDAARRLLGRPNTGVWVHGVHPDGCLWFVNFLLRTPGSFEEPPQP